MHKPGTPFRHPFQSSLAAQSVLVPAVLQMDADWIVLRDVMPDIRASNTPTLPSCVGFALLHPEHGIVLLDFAPDGTAQAVERLRRALAAAKFHKIFPGHLAIVYREITHEDVPRLAGLIRAALSAERATAIDGGQGWTRLARHVLGGVRLFDLGFSTETSQADSLSVAPPWVAEWRPAARSPGFGALGCFWAAVLATVAGGAAFLQYDYVPPSQAVRAEERSQSSAFGSDAPSRSPAPAATAPLAQDALITDTTALEAVRAPFPAEGQTPLMTDAGSGPDRATPAPAMSTATAVLAETMVRRAGALLQHGDVSAARLLYERAAASGSGHAATAMGRTFDAAFLAWTGVVGLSADPALAAKWYRRGLELGDDEARARLQMLQPAPGRTSIAMEAPSQ